MASTSLAPCLEKPCKADGAGVLDFKDQASNIELAAWSGRCGTGWRERGGFAQSVRFQPSAIVTGAPRPRPSASAALCSARAISTTPKELTRPRNSPGRTSP